MLFKEGEDSDSGEDEKLRVFHWYHGYSRLIEWILV